MLPRQNVLRILSVSKLRSSAFIFLSAAFHRAHAPHAQPVPQRSPQDIFSDVLGYTFCRQNVSDYLRAIGITFLGTYQPFDVVVGGPTGKNRHYHSGMFSVATDEFGELSFGSNELGSVAQFFDGVDLHAPTVTATEGGIVIESGDAVIITIPHGQAADASADVDHHWLNGCP
ncbi:hypothetical protein FOL46_003517 [Perkinsus olseni]|uniref:Uncharacterized protein n=1 Tax=Perkinsus olseni TaxID=32597 RepID=A0A7J6M2J1_PEROL|nr:hypothetical protein FOL46_003517 [Perkinsus olseni]